jgi:hypothetical protein
VFVGAVRSKADKKSYRLRPHAKLFRDRELGVPLTPQLHHGPVLLVSCVAAPLPARFDQRRSSGSFCLCVPRQFRPSLHLHLLELALGRLGQIAQLDLAGINCELPRRS